MTRVALAVGTVMIGGALIVAWQSGQSESATSLSAAPRPCVVGTPGCGPLPTLPNRHTPIPQDVRRRGAPRNGLLRPGTYNHHLERYFSVRFSVPAGWSWNGQALSKANAAVYFYAGPVRVYADPCRWDHAQDPSPSLYTPGSVESMAAALAAQPMRYATTPWVILSSLAGPIRGGPTATARGGGAIRVRLTVPSNLDLSRCDHGQYRTWGVGRNTRIQQGPGQRDLIWLSNPNLAPRPLIVDAATFPTTPTRLVHQVDAILASVEAGCWCY